MGKNCFFDLRDKVKIGNNVVISMQCTFITHIDKSKFPLSERYPSKSSLIRIHNNVCLGADLTLLMGVEIESNVIVAAKSLIRNHVYPETMVAGILYENP